MLVTVLIAGWFLLLPEEYKQVGKHTGGAAVFSSNFMLKKESGYFDTLSDLKPLLHLWSLAVEEQFYLIWPWLLWLALKTQRFGWTALFVLSITSLLYAILRTPIAAENCFFLLPARFWELAVGGLLAHAQLRQFRLPGIGAWVGLALNTIAAATLDRTLPFPGWRAILPVFGAALLLGSYSPFISSETAWPSLGGKHRSHQLSTLFVALAAFCLRAYRCRAGPLERADAGIDRS